MLLSIVYLFGVFILKFNLAEKIYPANEAQVELLKNILKNYHPSVRPAHANATVMLYVNIEMQHFDYREQTGSFHLVGLLHVKWRDPKLIWSPESYGNLSHITVSQRKIWIPDLEFYNNAPDKFIQMNRNGFVSVKNDGTVFWSDSIEANVFCTAEMKNWPHDRHECSINLGSWTFDGFEVDIMHLEPNSSMDFRSIDMQNMEYKITKFNASHVSKYYPCCLQPYVTMDYEITFERRSSYVIIFRVPALTIIMFTLMALRMEPNRKEKLWINSFSFILNSWQLIYFSRNIGHFHGTPNIVVFYSTCLLMITVAQLLAIFSLFATYSRLKAYLPSAIEAFLNSSFIRYLIPTESNKSSDCIDHFGQFEAIRLDDTSTLIDLNVSRNDWIRLANILNHLAFLAFSFIFIVLTSVCYV